MVLEKRNFPPESGNVDIYVILWYTFNILILYDAGRANMSSQLNTLGRSTGVALQAARRRSIAVGSMAVSESLKEKQVSHLGVSHAKLVIFSPF